MVSGAFRGMDKRTFLTSAVAILVTPFASQAQQAGKIFRVGYLSPGSRPPGPVRTVVFLRELGYIEGTNIHFEFRFAEGQADRLPELAAELVRLKVDVIWTSTNRAAFAAKNATATIPIVVFASHGAEETGLIAGYGKPGGNVTGTESLAPELDAKRLEMLRETLPKATKIAVLSNPLDQGTPLHQKWSGRAADALGLKLETVSVPSPKELEFGFATISKMHPDAVLVFTDTFLYQARAQIAEFTLGNRIPLFTEFKEYTELGGLMSYGANIIELLRTTAKYVAKILEGAKPADLPVERPSRLELVVNLKTARTLGLTIPRLLLIRADRSIE